MATYKTEDVGEHNKDKSYEARLCGRKINSTGARSWRVLVLGVVKHLIPFPFSKRTEPTPSNQLSLRLI